MNRRFHRVIFSGNCLSPAEWAAGHLISSAGAGEAVDLTGTAVLVPTRLAARRMRDALALRSGSFGCGLFPPWVMTPAQFLGLGQSGRMASGAQVLLAWIKALQSCTEEEIAPFLSPVKLDDASRLAGLAEKLGKLRMDLADGGIGFAQVAARGDLEEPERWQSLRIVEARYLQELQAMGVADPQTVRAFPVTDAFLEEGVKRVVLAFTPDPSQALTRWLDSLEEHGVAVEVLVHGPESWSRHFDLWGRPVPEHWNSVEIVIRNPEENIRLTANPRTQAECMVGRLRENRDARGLAGIGLGVPDTETSRCLTEVLSGMGIEVFDPGGRSLTNTGLYRLVDAFLDLRRGGTYESLAGFLRHGDVLGALVPGQALPLLAALDTFQNSHLPLSMDEMISRCDTDILEDRDPDNDSRKRLGAVLARVAGWIAASRDSLPGALRWMLEEIYSERRLDPSEPADRGFMIMAEEFDRIIREIEDLAAEGHPALLLETVLRARLREQSWQPEREGAPLVVEGWLELQWNPAPFLLVAGMNEGIVPDTQMGDIFLPDALRSRLGLRDDRRRLARDGYILTMLMEARRAVGGRCCLMLTKTRSSGEPARPSRLLFRCSEDELPARAAYLFGPAEDRPAGMPATVSFKLDPSLLRKKPAERVKKLTRLSVSALRSYLNCPMRFYFENLCGLERITDECFEPDALDFGSLIHSALEAMGRDARLWQTEDAGELADALFGFFNRSVREKYGANPPLGVEVARSAGRERLGAFARVHVEEVKAGWERLEVEKSICLKMGGLTLGGRVDRIERHREDGQIRILDYKTSDMAVSPRNQHIASGRDGKAELPEYAIIPPTIPLDGGTSGRSVNRWRDLQLPLYAEALRNTFDSDVISVGYAVLPKALNDTGLLMWPEYSDALHGCALRCAEGVVRDILRGRFWPPSGRAAFANDPFEPFFPAEAEKCMRDDVLRPAEDGT